MEFDNPISPALEDLRQEDERLRQALLGLTRAMKMQNDALAELYAHSQEHHAVINGHARVLETLEALMIGGSDATPAP